MSSLFLGIVLLNIGFVAGLWFKSEIMKRQMNVVLRYDKERLMWREIHDVQLVSPESDFIIGIKLPSSTDSTLL
tara:strand:- start:56 stop:277 length:222 start_codon:yes stop_codon:yes gene_type:complete